MIVGIDVYHDSTFGQKKSVVGFVASTNRYVQFVIYQKLNSYNITSLPPCFICDSLPASSVININFNHL